MYFFFRSIKWEFMIRRKWIKKCEFKHAWACFLGKPWNILNKHLSFKTVSVDNVLFKTINLRHFLCVGVDRSDSFLFTPPSLWPLQQDSTQFNSGIKFQRFRACPPTFCPNGYLWLFVNVWLLEVFFHSIKTFIAWKFPLDFP